MFPPANLILRRNRSSRTRRGVAAVEFAVVAPLFFLLVAGIIEFGQAFRIQHMLSNACRRGCRAAVVQNATSSQVQQKVKAHCTKTCNVGAGDVTVHVAVNGNPGADLSQAKNGDEISVTVSIPFSKAGIGFFANTFSNTTLSSTCTLEHE